MCGQRVRPPRSFQLWAKLHLKLAGGSDFTFDCLDLAQAGQCASLVDDGLVEFVIKREQALLMCLFDLLLVIFDLRYQVDYEGARSESGYQLVWHYAVVTPERAGDEDGASGVYMAVGKLGESLA